MRPTGIALLALVACAPTVGRQRAPEPEPIAASASELPPEVADARDAERAETKAAGLELTEAERAHLWRKVGALDQAAPLQGWDLSKEFATLRRLLERR
jgi:hypothetical protein